MSSDVIPGTGFSVAFYSCMRHGEVVLSSVFNASIFLQKQKLIPLIGLLSFIKGYIQMINRYRWVYLQ